jgi:5-hydroxyisourate hydrolase
MSFVTTHVLDAAHGRPAVGMAVRLERFGDSGGVDVVGHGRTDGDGRVPDLAPASSSPATTGWCSRPASGSPPVTVRRSTRR